MKESPVKKHPQILSPHGDSIEEIDGESSANEKEPATFDTSTRSRSILRQEKKRIVAIEDTLERALLRYNENSERSPGRHEQELKEAADKAMFELINLNKYRRVLTTVQHCYSECFDKAHDLGRNSRREVV